MPDAWNSECSKCGNPNAYQSLIEQECPNSKCENYSEKQKAAVEKELEEQEAAEREYALQETYNDADPSSADTDPPGPPDDPDDPYLYGAWGIAPPPVPVGTAAIPPPPQDNQDDADTYPYDLPQDMALD